MEEGTPTHSYLHAFCKWPNVTFENQGKNEQIVLMLRAHPITQISWIINVIILFILQFVANVVFAGLLQPMDVFMLNFFIVIFVLSYAWLNILIYLFNAGIVTNLKVLDVDFSAVIYKEVTEAKLDKIEDVTAKTAGYFASIFNFGSVFVQTAGTEENIEFLRVPRPSDVVQVINDLTQS
jgi:hypothetical protein